MKTLLSFLNIFVIIEEPMREKKSEMRSVKESFLISFITFLFFVQCGMSQQNDLNPKIKNESELHLQSKDAPIHLTDVAGATYCSGVLDTCLGKLEEIGISKIQLAKKVQCTVGDFDGNGYLDFAIWGIDKNKKGEPDYENYLVIFFEKSKVLRCIKIKSPSRGSLLIHYPPHFKVGSHGEPASINDALWLVGETDGYDDITKGTVYIFDLKTENFNMVKW